MRISSNTIALLAASSSIASAAPLARSAAVESNVASLAKAGTASVSSPHSVVLLKRRAYTNDASVSQNGDLPQEVKAEVFQLLDELSLIKEKRSFVEDETERAELEKRWVTALVLLVGVLYETGVIGAVWDLFTKDVEEQGPISQLIGNGITSTLIKVPQLLSGILASGFIDPFLNYISSDNAPKTGFLGSILGGIGKFFGLFGRSLDEGIPSDASRSGSGARILSKRESDEIAEAVVETVKEKGMTEDMVELGLQSPEQSPEVISAALSNGAISIEEVFRRTKQAGLTNEVLQYMTENEGTYAEPIAQFIEEKVEEKIAEAASSSLITSTASIPAPSSFPISSGVPLSNMLLKSTASVGAVPSPAIFVALIESGLENLRPNATFTGFPNAAVTENALVLGSLMLTSTQAAVNMMAQLDF